MSNFIAGYVKKKIIHIPVFMVKGGDNLEDVIAFFPESNTVIEIFFYNRQEVFIHDSKSNSKPAPCHGQ
jgi:hypothetical protein